MGIGRAKPTADGGVPNPPSRGPGRATAPRSRQRRCSLNRRAPRGGREQLVYLLGWGHPVERLSASAVELAGDLVELGVTHRARSVRWAGGSRSSPLVFSLDPAAGGVRIGEVRVAPTSDGHPCPIAPLLARSLDLPPDRRAMRLREPARSQPQSRPERPPENPLPLLERLPQRRVSGPKPEHQRLITNPRDRHRMTTKLRRPLRHRRPESASPGSPSAHPVPATDTTASDLSKP